MKRYLSLALALITLSALVVPAYTLACTTEVLSITETHTCNSCGSHPMGPDHITETTELQNQGDCDDLSWVKWKQVENYCGYRC